MQARKIGEVLLCITGIGYLLATLPTLAILVGEAVRASQGQSEQDRFVELAASLAVGLTVSISLVVWRGPLSARLFPSDDPIDASSESWLPAALAVVGVYYFVRGASHTLSFIPAYGGSQAVFWEVAIAPIAQTIFGAFLFLKAQGVSAIWRRLRQVPRGRERAA